MKCNSCGNELTERKCAKVYEEPGRVLVIKDVPCFYCPSCGETFFTFETLQRIENYANVWRNTKGDTILEYRDVA